jgi:hypothetical protein
VISQIVGREETEGHGVERLVAGVAFVGEADREGSDHEVCRFAAGFTAWYV